MLRYDDDQGGGNIRVHIHAGFPKTGTTTLQHFLAARRDWLAENGVLYPSLAYKTHAHHAILPALTDGAHISPSIRARMGYSDETALALSRECRADLVRQIAEAGLPRAILSSEGFTLFGSPAGAAGLARLAEETGIVPAFVLYVRSPPGRFLSALSQQLGHAQVRGPVLLNPLGVLNGLREHFPDADLIVRPFERAQLHRGDIVADFLRTVELPDEPPGRDDFEDRNVSVSAEAMCVLQRLGPPVRAADKKGINRQGRLRREIKLVDAALPGGVRPRLRPEVRAAILAESTYLFALRDDWGITFGDVDYDLVGRDLPPLEHGLPVEQICEVDIERRDALIALLSETPSAATTARATPRRLRTTLGRGLRRLLGQPRG